MYLKAQTSTCRQQTSLTKIIYSRKATKRLCSFIPMDIWNKCDFIKFNFALHVEFVIRNINYWSEIFKRFLNLKNIHKCFLCPFKRHSLMLCFIAFRFSRITGVTMQVKHVIGNSILHKLTIYNEYMCMFWVSTLFFMIYHLFSNCRKNLYYTVSIPIYIYNFLPVR